MRTNLQVPISDDLTLDAGSYQDIQTPNGVMTVIRPPSKTLFSQLLSYIDSKPAPPSMPSGSMRSREGVAATAMTLHFGSYLAVLLDPGKPIWPEVHSPTTSRISDGEMARINIESSAALCEWINLYRTLTYDEYQNLVNKVVFYLPMKKKTCIADRSFPLKALSTPKIAADVVRNTEVERLNKVRNDSLRRPGRLLANALIHNAWRNGSTVEDFHAGEPRGYPLDRRRFTGKEEGEIMNSTTPKLAAGMDICLYLKMEQPPRHWTEQELPFGLCPLLSPPNDWTLTESSCEVKLVQPHQRGVL